LRNNSINREAAETIIRIVKERKPKTVKQLATLVKDKLHIPEQEIVEFIIRLQSEGKISLTKQPRQTSPNLTAYLKTEQAVWYWITIAVSTATAAFVFIIPEDFYPWVYIRYVLGTIFVLWLSGYTFIKTLFPVKPPIKKSEKGLDTIERIALSLGIA